MSVPAHLFEEHYRTTPDPFRFEGNPFELTKYHAQLALLTDRRFASALELGCSIGIFTALLAPRCDRLLALDCAPSAVARVRERCAAHSGVTAEVATVPAQFPAGAFDLVTFAEFGYYLDRNDLVLLAERITLATKPGARLLVTHMTVDFEPYMGHPLASTYAQIHGLFPGDPNWQHLTRLKGFEGGSGAELYWCDLLERV